MGLLDITARVITKYTADVSEQKAKLEELAIKERELGVAQQQTASAHGEAIKGMVAGLGTLAAAVGFAKLAWDGYKEGIAEAKLAHAAAGVDMERLSKAAGGLKSQMELLTFAAKAHKSAWGNSQADLETAERAMRALEARGIDTETATNAVTNAVVGLKTKGLKALGLEIDESKVKLDEFGNVIGTTGQKLEIHKDIMKTLAKLGGEVSDSQENIGDAAKKSEVALGEAWRGIKVSMGELAASMLPLLEALAKAVGLVAKIAQYMPNANMARNAINYTKDALLGRDSFTPDFHPVEHNDFAATRIADQNALDAKALADTAAKARKVALLLVNKYLAGPEDINKDLEFKAPGKGDDSLQKAAAAFASKVAKDVTDEFIKTIEAEMDEQGAAASRLATSNALRGAAGLAYKPNQGGRWVNGEDGMPRWEGEAPGLSSGSSSSSNEASTVNSALSAFNGPDIKVDALGKVTNAGGELGRRMTETKTTSFLESTFGKIDEFHLYAKAFDMLAGASTKALNAWIEGSESASAAIKQFIGQSLEAVADQMLVEAIKEGAYALAYAAIGDPRAGMHAAAAAEFAGGAVVAAGLAHALGGGKSTPAPSGGQSGGSASATPSSLPPGSHAGAMHPGGTAVIVVGDQWTDDTQRMKQLKAKKYVDLAYGKLGYGVNFS